MSNNIKRFNCDICGDLDTHEKNYFGFNSTYGYCDNPACKKEATERLSRDVHEAIYLGDNGLAEDLLGDADPFELL